MAKAAEEQDKSESVRGRQRVDSGKAEVARGVSFAVGSVEVGGGPTGLCIRKASLANREEKWYTEARLGDAGNRLDFNPPQWTGRCLGVGLLGSPLQRLKSWAGAVFLNLPAPLSDGGKPGLAQGRLTVRVLFAVQAALQPAEGAQETRHQEQSLTLAGAPCGTPAPPARVARLEWSRACGACSPLSEFPKRAPRPRTHPASPDRGRGGAGGHPGVPVGGRRASEHLV